MIKDILIDDTGDLIIENGDFKMGESAEQHVVLLVNTMPGSWKQFPLAGVGIILFSASSGQSSTLRQLINTQLENDGFTNIDVTLVTGNDDLYQYYVTADINE